MSIRIVASVAIFLGLLSCGKRRVTGTADIFSPPRPLAELKERKLSEVSGLAASAAHPGMLWTHNDSGNPPVVYLVDEHLKIVLSCRLEGATNRDWEDIAVGPGPKKGQSYVYVADIGDNNASHGLKYIYRFEEPALSPQKHELTISTFDTIVFRLEDGKKDTEAIMLDPANGNLYVISKREQPVHVYELTYPFATRDTVTAKSVMSLPLTQIVSAGISPDGKQIVMKNYDHIYYWDRHDEPLVDVLRRKPEALIYREEPQGEAIAFNRNGTGLYTLSEKLFGEKIFLYFYKKRK